MPKVSQYPIAENTTGAYVVGVQGGAVKRFDVADIGGGSARIDLEYAELLALKGSFVTGQKYCITDFQTIHRVRGWLPVGMPQYNTDPEMPIGLLPEMERIIVTATGPDTLDVIAESLDYPQDVIYYELEDSSMVHPFAADRWEAQKGRILYREDTIQRVKAAFDFRNVVCVVGSSVESSGVFNSNSYRDIDFFDAKVVRTFDMDIYSDIDIDSELPFSIMSVEIRPTQDGSIPCIYFEGKVRKVSLDYGAEGYNFTGGDYANINAGCCCVINMNGGGDTINLGARSRINAAGNVNAYTGFAGSKITTTNTIDSVTVFGSIDTPFTTPLSNVTLGRNHTEDTNELTAVPQFTVTGLLLGPNFLITQEGGFATKMIAGADLLKGNVVGIRQATGADGKVWKSGDTDTPADMPMGVVYEDALTDESVWVITAGQADVLPTATETAVRGAIIWVGTEIGCVDFDTTVPVANHWKECGHFVNDGTGAGVLTRAILHFN